MNHNHDHHDACCGHNHGQENAIPLPAVEESLDPANQSLADALKSSFRVLKIIMFGVILFYLLSGFYKVDQNEVVIVTAFGRYVDTMKPGAHFAWPFPINERTSIHLDTKTVEIKSFWITMSKDDETRPLTQVRTNLQALKPGVDGALLTAADPQITSSAVRGSEGAELVHVRWNIAYRILPDRALEFNNNVGTDDAATGLVKAVFEAASVAMAARYTVNDIAFQNQTDFRVDVQKDAQKRLDELNSGIKIDNVDNVPYQPLQVRDEFDEVLRAENTKRSAIQVAEQESRRILNESVGESHVDITAAIRNFETARQAGADKKKLEELERHIDTLLTTVARGKASEVVQTARARSEQVVQELQAAADTLRDLKPKYDQSPVLLPVRLWEDAKRDIFASNGVMRFFLPSEQRQISIWLNRDPEQMRNQLQAKLQADNARK